jgi:hypothetical protein
MREEVYILIREGGTLKLPVYSLKTVLYCTVHMLENLIICRHMEQL